MPKGLKTLHLQTLGLQIFQIPIHFIFSVVAVLSLREMACKIYHSSLAILKASIWNTKTKLNPHGVARMNMNFQRPLKTVVSNDSICVKCLYFPIIYSF